MKALLSQGRHPCRLFSEGANRARVIAPSVVVQPNLPRHDKPIAHGAAQLEQFQCAPADVGLFAQVAADQAEPEGAALQAGAQGAQFVGLAEQDQVGAVALAHVFQARCVDRRAPRGGRRRDRAAPHALEQAEVGLVLRRQRRLGHVVDDHQVAAGGEVGGEVGDAAHRVRAMDQRFDRDHQVERTGQRIVGLNPADGALLWEHPYPWVHWPIGIATPVFDGDQLLISDVHRGSVLLKLGQQSPTVEQLWYRTNEDGAALHALMSTPLIIADHIYGADENGVLRCLKRETGEQVWEDDSAVPTIKWATIHLVRNRDRVWMFNDRGELIIAKLSPEGFESLGRAKLIDPTTEQLRRRDGVTWSHPAFANRHIYARNDRELVCADLSAGTN